MPVGGERDRRQAPPVLVPSRAARASRRRPPLAAPASGHSASSSTLSGASGPAAARGLRKQAKKRRVEAFAGPGSAASSVRFLDDPEQGRARFVPDTTSEDESCAEDLAARPTGFRRRATALTDARRRPEAPAPIATHHNQRIRQQSLPVNREQQSRRSIGSRDSRERKQPSPRPLSTADDATAARMLRSLGSWSSSMSSSSFRLSMRPSGAGAASAGGQASIEQRLLSSSAYSTSSQVEDGVLIAQARQAKKQLEAVAKRQVMVGKWKPLVRSKPDCQVFDSASTTKDQYSVVAKLNLPCSLREIMNVFSTDHGNEFHRSMEALFGDQYVYGVGLRSVDCSSLLTRRSSGQLLHPPRRPSFPSYFPQLKTAKLSLNAVSLLQKHRLVWKQRNMCFLDYLEEKIDDKSVIRVLRTMDDIGDDDDEDEPSSVSMTTSTAGSSSRQTQQHPHHSHSTASDRERRRELHGISIGYILQEDSEEKFTRLFFYATARQPIGDVGRKVSQSAVQLLRAMAMKACALEAVVLRRRLGFYPLVPLPTEGSVTQIAYCSACYIPFSMLRKKHFCRLCGHYTCRKCSSIQPVEKTVGAIGKHRICVTCVRRVSYTVFTTGTTFPPKGVSTAAGSGSKSLEASFGVGSLAEIPEDESPPILEDLAATDIEDIAMLNPGESTDVRVYMKSLLTSKNKGQQRVEDIDPGVRRLSGSDIDAWMDSVEEVDHATPPESISVLGSVASHSSASPRGDPRAWYPPSPASSASAATAC